MGGVGKFFWGFFCLFFQKRAGLEQHFVVDFFVENCSLFSKEQYARGRHPGRPGNLRHLLASFPLHSLQLPSHRRRHPSRRRIRHRSLPMGREVWKKKQRLFLQISALASKRGRIKKKKKYVNVVMSLIKNVFCQTMRKRVWNLWNNSSAFALY